MVYFLIFLAIVFAVVLVVNYLSNQEEHYFV